MSVTMLPRVPAGSREKTTVYSVAETAGQVPPSLLNQSIAIAGSKAFVFGGFDKFTDEMDANLSILDMNTNTWTRRTPRPTDEFLGVRSGHTTVVDGNRLILFGGQTEDNENTNDIITFDLEQDKWGVLTGEPELKVPQERSRHAACLTEDGTQMIVSGGMTSEGVDSTLYWYDFSQKTWSEPKWFVARYDHTIAVFHNKIWAFGGLGENQERVTEVSWYDINADSVGSALIGSTLPKPSSFGTHFYGCCGTGTMLDAVVPGSSAAFGRIQSNIAALDLKSFTWSRVMEDCDDYFAESVWYHMIAANDKLVFFGQPEDRDGERLSHVLTIDLRILGYSNQAQQAKGDALSPPAEGSIGYDMFQLLQHAENMSDFAITAVEGTERPNVLESSLEDIQQKFTVSEPIRVHVMVLWARWPHFKHVMGSHMQEYHDRTLFIPEPISWVRKLVEFMYRDEIDGCDVEEVTGLLILANVYDLPRLRQLCIEAISQNGLVTNATAILIWQRAMLADEPIVCRKAAMHCLRNWGHVVRSAQFAELSKQQLIELCNEADEHSAVVGHVLEGDDDRLSDEEDIDLY